MKKSRSKTKTKLTRSRPQTPTKTKYSVHPSKKHKKKLTPDQDHYYRIDSGRYKGVEFVYGDIRIETKKDAEAIITFDFDVLYSPLKKVKAELFTVCLKEILDTELLKLSEEAGMVDVIVPDDTPLLNFDSHTEEFNSDEILA